MIPHFRIASAETRHQHPDSEESTTFAQRNAHAPPPPRQRQISCTRIAFCLYSVVASCDFFVLEHLHPDLKAAFV